MALGSVDREAAKAKADEIALRFRRAEPVRPLELTLETLFEIYEREVTPTKGVEAQRHDRRCFEMFGRAFGVRRDPRTLSRREWDAFIHDRRAGRIAAAGVDGRRGVRDRIVQQDLQTLRAVLNWACRAGDGRGGVLLERNPLAGLVLPREESPRRTVVSVEQYEALRTAAGRLGRRAELFLVLAHETGHRGASIRRLRWSDVDFERRTVAWRPEHDKIGFAHSTPLTEVAAEALTREQTRQGAIGDRWIFPALRGDRSAPMSGDAASNLWKRIAKKAGIPEGERFGWHSLRRKFANELRHVPLRDLGDLGGWKSPQTILTCYQQPDEEAQREALARRRRPGQLAGIGAK